MVIENEKGERNDTSVKVVKKAAARAVCSRTGRRIKPRVKEIPRTWTMSVKTPVL